MEKKNRTIAIDGPSGAGKSTLAKLLAERLNLMYLDTGAMFRALAFTALKRGLIPRDREAMSDLLPTITLEVKFLNGEQRMIIDGRDVTPYIRDHAVSMAASDISVHREVRAWLLSRQRELAQTTSFVLDGRDIGTVVLPQADAKFFLTASVDVRAARRLRDLRLQGNDRVTLNEVMRDIEARDQQDRTRQTAPLRQAEDALLIDSGSLTIEQTLTVMLEHLRALGIAEFESGDRVDLPSRGGDCTWPETKNTESDPCGDEQKV